MSLPVMTGDVYTYGPEEKNIPLDNIRRREEPSGVEVAVAARLEVSLS